MKSFSSYFAMVFGTALFLVAVYTACSNSLPVAIDLTTCKRPARYATLSDIEKQRIALWANYREEHDLTLTAEQETKLREVGDLVGDIQLDRPVKFPNGKVGMPDGWLPELPAEHPWAQTPATTDESFAAWFEVRIVDPLLYDPDLPTDTYWAHAYLEQTAASTDGAITSYVGADSSCP